MVSRHVDDAHLMPGGAAGCAGATFARLRSAPISLSKCLTNFCFYVPGVRCRHLWSYRAVRGLYGRVARQYTLVRGLRGVCRPLSSVQGWPVWGPLERCFQGTKPGNRARDWVRCPATIEVFREFFNFYFGLYFEFVNHPWGNVRNNLQK